MCSIIKDEFRLRHVWLNHSRPQMFYTSQWRWPRQIFVIFRLLAAGYTVFGLTYLMVRRKGETMVFLTTWTYIVLFVHFVLSAAIAVWCLKKYPENANCHRDGVEMRPFVISSENTTGEKVIPTCTGEKGQNENTGESMEENNGNVILQQTSVANTRGKQHKEYSAAIGNDMNENGLQSSESTPDPVYLVWYLKLAWFVSDVISVWAVIVTLMYFSVIYPSRPPGIKTSLMDINVHAINSVLVLLDVIFSARPVRLLHVLYPLIYGLVYVLFTIIYWAKDHTHILYAFLDYNRPGTAVAWISGIGLVGIPVVHSLLFGIYRLRLYIYMKVYGEKY